MIEKYSNCTIVILLLWESLIVNYVYFDIVSLIIEYVLCWGMNVEVLHCVLKHLIILIDKNKSPLCKVTIKESYSLK